LIYSRIAGKVPFTDKYGLRYYLWPDTRLVDTMIYGCRTDDEGIILLVQQILRQLQGKREQQAGQDPLIIIDVGAYIGVISLSMAQFLHASDRLFAFEPLPLTFERLKQNIRLNRYEPTVAVIPWGVADQIQEHVHLCLTKVPGDNYIMDGPLSAKFGRDKFCDIRTTTIDAFAKERRIETITILKVDAEGKDFAVLRGTEKFLKEGQVSYLFVEHDADYPQNNSAVLDLLRRYGYQIYYIVRNTDRVVRDIRKYPAGYKAVMNLLAISPRAPLSAEDLMLKISDEKREG